MARFAHWQSYIFWGFMAVALAAALCIGGNVGGVIFVVAQVPFLWLIVRSGYFRRLWAFYTQTPGHVALAAAVFVLVCFFVFR